MNRFRLTACIAASLVLLFASIADAGWFRIRDRGQVDSDGAYALVDDSWGLPITPREKEEQRNGAIIKLKELRQQFPERDLILVWEGQESTGPDNIDQASIVEPTDDKSAQKAADGQETIAKQNAETVKSDPAQNQNIFDQMKKNIQDFAKDGGLNVPKSSPASTPTPAGTETPKIPTPEELQKILDGAQNPQSGDTLVVSDDPKDNADAKNGDLKDQTNSDQPKQADTQKDESSKDDPLKDLAAIEKRLQQERDQINNNNKPKTPQDRLLDSLNQSRPKGVPAPNDNVGGSTPGRKNRIPVPPTSSFGGRRPRYTGSDRSPIRIFQPYAGGYNGPVLGSRLSGGSSIPAATVPTPTPVTGLIPGTWTPPVTTTNGGAYTGPRFYYDDNAPKSSAPIQPVSRGVLMRLGIDPSTYRTGDATPDLMNKILSGS